MEYGKLRRAVHFSASVKMGGAAGAAVLVTKRSARL